MKRHVLRHLKNNHEKQNHHELMKRISKVSVDVRQKYTAFNCIVPNCYISCQSRNNLLRHLRHKHDIHNVDILQLKKGIIRKQPPIPQQRCDIKDIGKYGKMTYADYERVLKYTNTSPLNNTSCSIWNAWCVSKTDKGNQHGMFSFRGKTVRVHCLMYHNFVGPLPNDFGRPSGKDIPAICHTCDSNGRCVNINHIYLGTISTNTRDKLIHGNGPQQKLSVDDVKEIKNLANVKANAEIAKQYNITTSELTKILKGKILKWV